MSSPKISVIIPCFNGETFLAEAIDSVLQQTFVEYEVIVVDDGSTDSSSRIMKQYGSAINVVRQSNAGLSAARNAGIAVSRGRFLAFLDSDDYWRQDFLEKMVTTIESSGAQLAYCGWQNVGLPGDRGKPYIPPDYENSQQKLEFLFKNTCWPVHAAVIRREIVEMIGGFDPKWRACEDFAFWLRAAIKNRIVLVPEVMAFYRFHGVGQMTNNRASIALNRFYAQQEYQVKFPEIVDKLNDKLSDLTYGELLRSGYECYWARDLTSARKIFRQVMKVGYGEPRDWKYMLPSLFPLAVHTLLMKLISRRSTDG